MLIPVVIHKDRTSDYGVTVPALPGCFSAGESIEEALVNAREAIELHLEGMLDDGAKLPEMPPVDSLRRRREFQGGLWFIVEIDPARLLSPAKRINITLPERLLTQIDRAAAAAKMTRSGFLADAAFAHIARGSSRDPAKKPRKTGRRS